VLRRKPTIEVFVPLTDFFGRLRSDGGPRRNTIGCHYRFQGNFIPAQQIIIFGRRLGTKLPMNSSRQRPFCGRARWPSRAETWWPGASLPAPPWAFRWMSRFGRHNAIRH